MAFDLAKYKIETRQYSVRTGPIRFGLAVSGLEYFLWHRVLRPLWSHCYWRHPRLPAAQSFQPKHVENCRVFADRWEILRSLSKGKIWAEVGTYEGAFARDIIDICEPSQIDLIDISLDPLKKRGLVHETGTVAFHAGDSADSLLAQPDNKYDYIYIDASHDLIDVARDAEAATRKLKPGGLIIFNDYTCFSLGEMRPYGVVLVVNSLVASGTWEVACFAFQPNMYCDIALRRVPD
jgi:hypothetical protein